MASFRDAYYLSSANPFRRLWRNVRLFFYVLRIVWLWTVPGGRVRRAVARARKSGQPLSIDFLADVSE